MPKYELLPIEQLVEPEIPAREGMDETKLNELAESVREVGYIHPIAVVLLPQQESSENAATKTRGKTRGKTSPPRYEIIDGHRRYKVGVMLQLNALPCLVFVEKDTAREAIKLHTALYREDLSVAEEAAFIADLINKYDYTEEQLCRAVRQKVSWVNERLGILHGNADVFEALRQRKINMAVAKQLNRVKDEAQTRVFLDIVVQGGATAVMTAKWVSEWLARRQPTNGQPIAAQTETAPAPEAAPGPSCFFCKKEDSPYNMQNVWIHEWEKKMIEAQIERASQPIDFSQTQ
jgi:ParB family transcriptional regulator, chromosome partitioning protein